jgi:hypothetical protein
MGRRLIVANQTLGGADLEQVLVDRIERGEGDFHIVVPMIEPEAEAVAWGAAEIGFIVLPPGADAMEEARRRSEHRLDAIVSKIERAGGTATGEVGDHDPAAAVRRVLEQDTFDEIIVSTLPAGLSRWLKMDLPSRISRMTDIPVTVVEARDR